MELRTLDEINRGFLAGSQAPGSQMPGSQAPGNQIPEPKSEFAPITPLVIKVELPDSMKARGSNITKAKDTRRHGRRPSAEHSPKGRGTFTTVSDMLFSMAIIMILFVALVPGSDDGVPKSIFNYSYFTVETPSMQDEIPQGSFILVKSINPQKLREGDNITYLAEHNTAVTHKVVAIYENYDNSGAIGIQTKGVNNANPDRDIVNEASIVGKVVFVFPVFGTVLSYLSDNVFLVFTIFGLCVLLSFLLRGKFAKPAKRTRPENNQV